MRSNTVLRLFIGLYLVVFFGYLFLPLGVMVAAAFNASSFPTVIPWQGFTLEWFDALFADQRMWRGMRNSIIIGAGVILLSIPLGLAAALLLTRLRSGARNLLYGILVSPILTPGVIIGISTLIFWNRFVPGPGGILLTIVAQSSFIAAYCMLLFLARLQRFDPALEEAALDLGASQLQVFWKIMVPFLMPAIASAAALSFLQSFENYNTTLFVILPSTTMTIEIGSKVRQAVTPAVNAIGVILIALTVLGAILYELRRRAEQAHQAVQAELAKRAEQVSRRPRLQPVPAAAAE